MVVQYQNMTNNFFNFPVGPLAAGYLPLLQKCYF